MVRNGKARVYREVTSCGTLPWRTNDGRVEVLLIKQFKESDRWGIPKGHRDVGEDLKACAARETREETGLKVKLGTSLPSVMVTSRDERKTVFAWFARPLGSDVPDVSDPDCEVADAQWFDIDGLPDVVVYQRPMLQQAVGLLRHSPELAFDPGDEAPVNAFCECLAGDKTPDGPDHSDGCHRQVPEAERRPT